MDNIKCSVCDKSILDKDFLVVSAFSMDENGNLHIRPDAGEPVYVKRYIFSKDNVIDWENEILNPFCSAICSLTFNQDNP